MTPPCEVCGAPATVLFVGWLLCQACLAAIPTCTHCADPATHMVEDHRFCLTHALEEQEDV